MRATLTGRLGVVGGLSLALFFAWPSTPAIASPSCTPTANGQSGSSSRTNASGTQYCTGGDTGIYYQAVGGDLTVNLNNDPITGHAININDDSVGRSITVNNGLAGENYAATPIVATDSSKYAVNLQSSGGNLQFTSLSGGSVTFAGSGAAGAAISARTSGAGTIAITTDDTVTDPSGNGITAEGSNGAIAVATYGKLTAGADGIYASSASGAISVTANGGIGATNGIVAASTGGGNINVAAAAAAIDASGTGIDTSGSGNTAVALYSGSITASGGFGIESAATGAGTLSLATAAGTTITAGEAGLYASSDSGSIYISASGAISSPSAAIDVASGSGPITVVTGAGSNTTSTANDGIYANSASGPVTVVADGNVTAPDSPILANSGGGSAVTVYAGAPSAPVNLTSTASSTWNTIALSNGGNVDITDYGTVKGGLYAQTTGAGTATVYTGPGSSLVTTGTPATSSGDGIDAFGVNGAVYVAANGNVAASGYGINAQANGSGNSTVVVDSANSGVIITAPVAINTFSATGTADSVIGNGDTLNGDVFVSNNLSPGSSAYTTYVSVGAHDTINAPLYDAVHAGIDARGGGVSISIGADDVVNATAPNGTTGMTAILAGAFGGDIAVSTGIGSTINSSGIGIQASSPGGGPVWIDAGGNVISTGNAAIYATGVGTGSLTLVAGTQTNPVLIGSIRTFGTTTYYGTAITADEFGSGPIAIETFGTIDGQIAAVSFGGSAISITTNGNITSSSQPAIIALANSVQGSVNIAVEAGIVSVSNTSLPAILGLVQFKNGGPSCSCNVSISLESGVVVDPGGFGVEAQSQGGQASIDTGNDVNIVAIPGPLGSNLFAGAGILAESDSPVASSTPTSIVTTGSNTVISVAGDNSAGVTAINGGSGNGDAAIQLGSGNAITVSGDTSVGIAALAKNPYSSGSAFDGSGAATVTVGGNNAIEVDAGSGSNGALGTSTGIEALSDGGNVAVTWSDSGGSVVVHGAPGVATTGIGAATTGGGTVIVATGTGTAITSDNGPGVSASSQNGALSVVADGPVTAGGPAGVGILALASGSGDIAITTAGNVHSVQASAVSAIGASGAIAIMNSAVLTGAGTAANPVISLSTAGATSVVNSASGTIQSNQGAPGDLLVAAASGTGAVNISNAGTMTGRANLSNASAASFTNTGTWNTSGTSNFGAGNSSLSNSGKVVTTGATVFAFAGSGNTFTNSGTLQVQGSIAFQNVQTFSNTGTLVVSHPAGTAGVITIPGVFAGGTNSGLTINAFLGTAGSGAACGALADCLQIQGSTGVTELLVKDTGAMSDAGVNDTGVLVVSGASAAGDFVLDSKSPGYNPKSRSIDVGFFTYGLGYDPSDQQVRLYGQPNALAYQLPEIVTAAQTLWYATSPSQERQTDLGGAIGPDGSGNVTTGVWMKSVGSFAHRTTHAGISFGGTIEALDTSYGEDSYGFVIGVDNGRRALWLDGDMLIGGFMAGYVGSRVDFRGTPTTASLEGPLVGAYLTYLDDGLSVDVSFKADFLRIQYADTSGAIFATPSSETSFGGEIDVGKRLPLTGIVYVEPLASMTWMESSADSTAAYDATVRFGKNTSSRGSAGLRTGALMVSSDGTTFDVSLTARLWDTFEGTNTVTVLSPGVPATLSDRFGGAIGDVSVDVNVFGANNGWSGFLNADMQYKDGFTGLALAAGARYRW